MSDLIIQRMKDRTVLVPCTPKGIDWIQFQVKGGSTTFSISNDVFDEAFLDALSMEGLTFEIK